MVMEEEDSGGPSDWPAERVEEEALQTHVHRWVEAMVEEQKRVALLVAAVLLVTVRLMIGWQRSHVLLVGSLLARRSSRGGSQT